MIKILYVSNTANFQKFNKPFMKWCKQHNWQVDYCAPADEHITDCDNHIVLPIPRNPFSKGVFKCIKQMKSILYKNKYDIIHCHTPMGSVISRIAAKKLFRNHDVKIIYTAHGFHFYKGAPIKNWLIYYPVEKYLAKFTDIIITINREDYELAVKKLKRKTYFLDGVGVDISKYTPVHSNEEKNQLRQVKGFLPNDFILLYTAEFIPRKNHKLLFDILPILRDKIPNLKVILAGKGELLNYYKDFVEKNNYNDVVTFLGYTKEIPVFCKIADLLFMPSFQEGLPISMIEAIATGLPVVASNIRGHNDVIISNDNGFLCELNDKESFINSIYKLYKNEIVRNTISKNNIERSKVYSTDIAVSKMAEIYLSCINED